MRLCPVLQCYDQRCDLRLKPSGLVHNTSLCRGLFKMPTARKRPGKYQYMQLPEMVNGDYDDHDVQWARRAKPPKCRLDPTATHTDQEL